MKLVAFQVTHYKVIEDSTRVIVDPHVTALVGKNESGKSALLHALWKSRNLAGAIFDSLYDYPRGSLPPTHGQPQDATVLEFELSTEERENLAEEMPHVFAQPPKSLFCRSSYTGGTTSTHEVEFDSPIIELSTNDIRQEIQGIISGIRNQTDREDLSPLPDAAAQAIAAIDDDDHLWTPSTLAALTAVYDAIENWLEPSDLSTDMTAVTARLEHLISQGEQGNPKQAVDRWATERLPTFVYFDDYSQLDPSIHLPSYIEAIDSADLKTRTQTALFERSGVDPQQLLHLGRERHETESEDAVYRRIEERIVLLNEASRNLTDDWNEWWTEGTHTLRLDIDGEYLTLKVSDKHNAPIPFEERSHGFRWFFSFYLVFLSESDRSHKDAILLLDEPGLHLHPALQSQLLELFEQISEKNQLIYTTHMPFLIDGSHIERVRTVYLTEPGKARVSNNVRPEGDRDTLLPIQAAVGYSIAQTLFFGKRSLIVEGVTDYWYIKTLSACLSTLGTSPVLSNDTVLIPAGGTSRLMPLASVMFASTHPGERSLSVLLDSDSEGELAAGRVTDSFAGELTIIMLGQVIALEHATIEDLLPRSDYAEAVKETGHAFALKEEEKRAPTNVQAIRLAFQREGIGEFGLQERADTALRIIGRWSSDPSSVPKVTQKRAYALFAAINERFAAIERV